LRGLAQTDVCATRQSGSLGWVNGGRQIGSNRMLTFSTLTYEKPGMKLRLCLLIGMLFSSAPAFAQASKMDAELEALRAYCKSDIERLCPNVEPGGGRIKECLMAQKEQMTVGCAQALQKLQKEKKKP
jgi:hypothetical protein